jgi:hypothetical protein
VLNNITISFNLTFQQAAQVLVAAAFTQLYTLILRLQNIFHSPVSAKPFNTIKFPSFSIKVFSILPKSLSPFSITPTYLLLPFSSFTLSENTCQHNSNSNLISRCPNLLPSNSHSSQVLTPSPPFLVLSHKLEFDTIKARILEKISQGLKPKTITFEHYSVAWSIPRTQASSMPLCSPTDYQFLLHLASKQKTSSVNLLIKAHLLKNNVYVRFLSACMH